jgi:hypothetical protein
MNIMKLKKIADDRGLGFVLNYDFTTIDKVQSFYYDAYHKKLKLEMDEQELRLIF